MKRLQPYPLHLCFAVPELLASRLLCTGLERDEAIVVVGAEQVWRHG